MRLTIILSFLLLFITYVHCVGYLEVTYAGRSCTSGRGPRELRYEDMNSLSCNVVTETNCTTSERVPGDYQSKYTICARSPNELPPLAGNTTAYFTSIDYTGQQCDGVIKTLRYISSISNSCIPTKTTGVYYRHVCNKDGEMTLTSCSDYYCTKCSGVVTPPNGCFETFMGSTMLGCTAGSGATQMTLSVGVLLTALLCFLF